MDAEIVKPGPQVGDKIGNPEPLTDEVIAKKGTEGASTSRSDTRPAPSKIEPPSSMNQSLTDTRVLSQISSLTPYHNKWVIKARVTNKSDMRSWSNSRGEGKLFNVDLMDESGEIRCTAFRDLAEKYFDYLQVSSLSGRGLYQHASFRSIKSTT